MESIDFKALFNSPEPDTIEQQKAQPPYVYREQYAEDGEQYEKYHYSDGTSVKYWLGLND